MEPQIKLTEEQQKESQTRLDEFNTKFAAMCKEYQVELMFFPQYVPTPHGATTICNAAFRDLKYAPIKSPFSPEHLK